MYTEDLYNNAWFDLVSFNPPEIDLSKLNYIYIEEKGT